MSIQTILHPTDYSELSQFALRQAEDLARVHSARLIVLHVVETLGPERLTYAEAGSQPQPEAYRKRLWDEMHRLVSPDPDVPVEYVLAQGDPVSAILRTAADHRCDMIVLGSHGRTGLQRLVLGSIAEGVMRRARCPVLIVKIPPRSPSSFQEEGTALHPFTLTEGRDSGSRKN